MSDSTRLQLTYLAAAQAQKHVSVNESLRRLDALVQLSAKSRFTAAQPASPADGDIYMLPSGKTGADWGAMADGALAYYRDGAWEELTPKHGWRCYIEDEDALMARGASAWVSIGAAAERSLIFTPGGDGVVSVYRIDTPRVQNPRTATISSVSGDEITLSAAVADTFFGAIMAGVSYLRIWNTSKTPAEPAWVKSAPTADKLEVLDAAALSGWAGGETVQIGDPTSVTPNNFIALDISPMMQTVLGRVFRQAGLVCKVAANGVGTQSILSLSEAGVSGAHQPTRSLLDGSIMTTQTIIPSSVQSPISNSNLLFVQELAPGAAAGVAVVSVQAVLV